MNEEGGSLGNLLRLGDFDEGKTCIVKGDCTARKKKHVVESLDVQIRNRYEKNQHSKVSWHCPFEGQRKLELCTSQRLKMFRDIPVCT